jgi:hypothetical protein
MGLRSSIWNTEIRTFWLQTSLADIPDLPGGCLLRPSGDGWDDDGGELTSIGHRRSGKSVSGSGASRSAASHLSEIMILVPTIGGTMRLPSVRLWSSTLSRTLGSPQIAT